MTQAWLIQLLHFWNIEVLPMLDELRVSSTLWKEIKLGSISVSVCSLVATGNVCLFFQLWLFTPQTLVWRNSPGVFEVFEVPPPQNVREKLSYGPCHIWGLGPVSQSQHSSHFWLIGFFMLILDWLQLRGWESMVWSYRFHYLKNKVIKNQLLNKCPQNNAEVSTRGEPV